MLRRWWWAAAGVGLAVAAGLAAWPARAPSSATDPEQAREAPDPQAFLAGLPAGRAGADADKVVAALSARLKASPSDARLWASLGDALMQKARETADAAYFAHAERAFQTALGQEPDLPDALVGLAWVAGGRHEFERSVEWAEKALAARPDDPNPHALIGDARMELGDYEAAGRHFQAMLDLRPDQASYCRGAQWLFATGDVRKALWLMRKAVEAGGRYTENTAWCIAQMALMHFHTGALLPAEQQVNTALKKAPDNHHLLAVAGRLKAARGEYGAAIELYRKAAAAAPQHDTLVALADLYRLTGEPGKAAEQESLVEATHKLNKANGVRGDAQLARFWADRGRNLPEALALAEEEYRARKNVAVADALAWCLFKSGRPADADAVMRKALKHKTPDPSLLYHAGAIQAALGRRADAARLLYQALSLNSRFHPVDANAASALLAEVGGDAPPTK
jgi:tetratricopeptide (TPR) repeat protein